jgi:antitoxin VapB
MTQTAKLFMNGRSQAVRLPAEFRFEGKEVYIERDGDRVILRPKPEDMGKWMGDFFARTPTLPDDFLADRNDTPPQDREWFHDENA